VVVGFDSEGGITFGVEDTIEVEEQPATIEA
jgi:hypothetical protein